MQVAVHMPKLCIVDLDKTIWNVFSAADTEPPYRRVSECEVRDAAGRTIRMHVDTPKVLKALRSRGCRLGVASLNPNHERCSKLLAALGLLSLFETSLIKIRSGQGKYTHLSEIQASSTVAFRDMVFFDDVKANVVAGSKLGITSVLVNSNLLCADILKEALSKHAAAQRSRSFMGGWLSKGALATAPPPTEDERAQAQCVAGRGKVVHDECHTPAAKTRAPPLELPAAKKAKTSCSQVPPAPASTPAAVQAPQKTQAEQDERAKGEGKDGLGIEGLDPL